MYCTRPLTTVCIQVLYHLYSPGKVSWSFVTAKNETLNAFRSQPWQEWARSFRSHYLPPVNEAYLKLTVVDEFKPSKPTNYSTRTIQSFFILNNLSSIKTPPSPPLSLLLHTLSSLETPSYRLPFPVVCRPRLQFEGIIIAAYFS